jgi:hypothetical protein
MGDLKPVVQRIKERAKFYPLSHADDRPEMKCVNSSPELFVTEGPGDYQFWELDGEKQFFIDALAVSALGL